MNDSLTIKMFYKRAENIEVQQHQLWKASPAKSIVRNAKISDSMEISHQSRMDSVVNGKPKITTVQIFPAV